MNRIAVCALLLAFGSFTRADDVSLSVELNKLEPHEDACRAYLVFDNTASSVYESLKLDLVMFDPDGVISRRLAVEGAPLAADKTTVKLFDIAGVACADIGRVLLNDILACRDDAGEHDDCLSRLQLESRAGVPFVK